MIGNKTVYTYIYNHLVYLTNVNSLNRAMARNLSENTTITSTNNQNLQTIYTAKSSINNSNKTVYA